MNVIARPLPDALLKQMTQMSTVKPYVPNPFFAALIVQIAKELLARREQERTRNNENATPVSDR